MYFTTKGTMFFIFQNVDIGLDTIAEGFSINKCFGHAAFVLNNCYNFLNSHEQKRRDQISVLFFFFRGGG